MDVDREDMRARARAVGDTHGDFEAIIGEDEGRVGRSELGGRHCDCGFGVR